MYAFIAAEPWGHWGYVPPQSVVWRVSAPTKYTGA